MRARRAGVVLAAVAVVVTTFLPWAAGGVEGAYFNRSVGASADAAVFVRSGGVMLWSSAAWLAVVLVAAAIGALLVASGRTARPWPLVGLSALGALVAGAWTVATSVPLSYGAPLGLAAAVALTATLAVVALGRPAAPQAA